MDLCRLYAQCVHHSGKHPDCESLFDYLFPVFTRIAGRVARQFGAAPEIEDVVQDISLKMISSGEAILPGVPGEPAAALAYFSVLAANAARDFFRSRLALKRGERSTVPMDDRLRAIIPAVYLHTVDRDLLLKEIEASLPPDSRDQTIYRLYYRQGFSAKEIAAIPALELSVKGVESLIHRITTQLRHRIGDSSSGSRTEKGVSRIDSYKQ